MKELKAVLNFADITGMSVNLHFDQPGRPIIVALEENIDFIAEFVLATFEETYQQFHEDINDVEEMIMISQNQKKNNTNESLACEKLTQQSINKDKTFEKTNINAFKPINTTFIENKQNNSLDNNQIVTVSQNLKLHNNEIIPSINNQTIIDNLEIEFQINNDINFQNNYDQIKMMSNLSIDNTNQPNISYNNNENCGDKSFTALVVKEMSKNCFDEKDNDEFHLIIPNSSQPRNTSIIENQCSFFNNFMESNISITPQKNNKNSENEFKEVRKIKKKII